MFFWESGSHYLPMFPREMVLQQKIVGYPTFLLCSTSVASHSCTVYLNGTFTAGHVEKWYAVQVSDTTMLGIAVKAWAIKKTFYFWQDPLLNRFLIVSKLLICC